MTAHLWFWAAIAVQIAALIALAATVYGYSREVEDLRAERDADYAELAGRIEALTPEPATGPINAMDRPTPAQIAAPTRPDLQAQPKVPSGRHRAAA